MTPSWEIRHRCNLESLFIRGGYLQSFSSVYSHLSLPMTTSCSFILTLIVRISALKLIIGFNALSTFSVESDGLRALCFDVLLSDVSCYVSIFIVSPSFMNMNMIVFSRVDLLLVLCLGKYIVLILIQTNMILYISHDVSLFNY